MQDKGNYLNEQIKFQMLDCEIYITLSLFAFFFFCNLVQRSLITLAEDLILSLLCVCVSLKKDLIMVVVSN